MKAVKSDEQLRFVVEPEPGSQILILRQTLETQKAIEKSQEEGFRFINDLETFYFAECKGVNPPPDHKGYIFASEVVAYEKTYVVRYQYFAKSQNVFFENNVVRGALAAPPPQGDPSKARFDPKNVKLVKTDLTSSGIPVTIAIPEGAQVVRQKLDGDNVQIDIYYTPKLRCTLKKELNTPSGTALMVQRIKQDPTIRDVTSATRISASRQHWQQGNPATKFGMRSDVSVAFTDDDWYVALLEGPITNESKAYAGIIWQSISSLTRKN